MVTVAVPSIRVGIANSPTEPRKRKANGKAISLRQPVRSTATAAAMIATTTAKLGRGVGGNQVASQQIVPSKRAGRNTQGAGAGDSRNGASRARRTIERLGRRRSHGRKVSERAQMATIPIRFAGTDTDPGQQRKSAPRAGVQPGAAVFFRPGRPNSLPSRTLQPLRFSSGNLRGHLALPDTRESARFPYDMGTTSWPILSAYAANPRSSTCIWRWKDCSGEWNHCDRVLS